VLIKGVFEWWKPLERLEIQDITKKYLKPDFPKTGVKTVFMSILYDNNHAERLNIEFSLIYRPPRFKIVGFLQKKM